MSEIWIINGRCEDCLRRELDGDGDYNCGCWCHDICEGCGDPSCTGEDCYVPEEIDL